MTGAAALWATSPAKKRISANPFGDVVISVPRKVQTREEGKALSPSEQQVILQAALAIADTTSVFNLDP